MEDAPLTFGSKLFANYVADRDNGSVLRAKQAGLVIIGKTNTPEFGFVSTTESQLLGAARNPYNAAYHTGGSSGGAGAAVASGMVPFAHASDGGGSIRIPASGNGLVGLKPSRGRLFTNSPPLSNLEIAVRLAVSRSVRDTAQILNVSELKNPAPPLSPVGFVSGPSTKRLKIAFGTLTYDGKQAHPHVRRVNERAAKLCSDLGHRVEEVDVNLIDADFIYHFMSIWSSAAYDLVENARLIGLMQMRWINPQNALEQFTHGLADLFRARVRDNPDILAEAADFLCPARRGL